MNLSYTSLKCQTSIPPPPIPLCQWHVFLREIYCIRHNKFGIFQYLISFELYLFVTLPLFSFVYRFFFVVVVCIYCKDASQNYKGFGRFMRVGSGTNFRKYQLIQVQKIIYWILLMHRWFFVYSAKLQNTKIMIYFKIKISAKIYSMFV